jgi:hypothetical protein
LRALAVARALDRDPRRGFVDFPHVVRGQHDVDGAEVFFETVQLRGAGNRHDPRLPREQPRERDLCRRGVLFSRDAFHEIDDVLIGFAVLRREPRHGVAKVGGVERRRLVDLPGEEAFAEGAEGDESDAELLEHRQDLLLGLSPPDRVLALQRRHGLHGVRAADVLHARFGQTEVLHFSFADQLFDRAGDVLHRHVGIDAMLVEEVDRLDAQAFEGTVDGAADGLGTAVQSRKHVPAFVEVEAELRGDRDPLAKRRERFANHFFVRERAVDLRGVEEGHAAFDGAAKQRDGIASVRRRTEAEAEAHAAQTER